VDDVLLPLYEKFRHQVDLERVIVVPLMGKQAPAGMDDYEAFLRTASGHFEYPQLDENAPCAMCYTSGTTGRPKGVVYSHRSQILHSLVQALPDAIGISGRDVILPVVPMFHANAWGVPYTAAMLGVKMVFPGPHLHPDDLIPLLESEQVTISCGVPTIWLPMVHLLEKNWGKLKLHPGLRLTVGGSAVPESMIRAYAKLGIEVLQGWGMTETSPLASIAKITAMQDHLGADERFAVLATQGYPMPLVDIRTVGDAGEQPWDGKSVGEIQVHGPWITGSYYNQPAPENFAQDGWLRTGDVASLDPLGFIRITDRTKDLIKSGGEWISSVDLENAIMGHPAVQECAVVAVPHPKWAERPLAVIVLKPGAQATEGEIKGYLAQRFVKWMVPDAYVFVDAIPKTTTGKFLKTKLREMYRDWKWADAA
jgi:fatty-acyl-CoA synthase